MYAGILLAKPTFWELTCKLFFSTPFDICLFIMGVLFFGFWLAVMIHAINLASKDHSPRIFW